MVDFYIAQNDREPNLRVTCLDEVGEIVPLTGVTTVVFSMINPGLGTPKISNSPATVIDAPNGIVEYAWGATDTDTPGDYDGEFEVSWPGGEKTTFPNHKVIQIRIRKQIA